MLRMDVSTFGLSSAIVSISCCLILLTLYGYKGRSKKIMIFAAYTGLYGAGLFVVLFKGSVNNLLQGYIGNIMCLSAIAIQHYGVARICHMRPYPIFYALVLSAFSGLYYYFGYKAEGISIRISIISVTQIVLYGDMAFAIYEFRRSCVRRVVGIEVIWASILFSIFCAVIRAADANLAPIDYTAYYDAKGLLAGYYALTTMGRLAFTLGLIILLNETTEAHLQERIDHATADIRIAKEAAELAAGELRKAKEDAEHEVSIRRNFIAAASHDLRQPVHSLGIITKTLADVMKCSVGENCRKHYELAALAAEDTKRLAKLLEELLDLARLQAVVDPLEQEPISVNSILEEVQRRNIREANKADVILQVMSTSLNIRADAAVVTRALSNLVQNAIKFSEPEKTVIIGCRRLRNEISIEVHDEGPGIPKDKLITIFEPFTQLNNKERNSTKGSGLGLSIVKEAVRAIGGRLVVSSKVGKGTMFAIRLGTA